MITSKERAALVLSFSKRNAVHARSVRVSRAIEILFTLFFSSFQLNVLLSSSSSRRLPIESFLNDIFFIYF